MKKVLLFVFALFIVTGISAQQRAFLFQESFDGSSIPAGWQVTGQGTSNWSISATNKAGGTPNELHLAWSPQFNGVSRMVMGSLDLSNYSEAYLSFKHYLDNYQGSTTIGFSTSTDGGTTWHDAWTQSFSASGNYEVLTQVSTADFGQSNVMISFYFSGSSYNINDWFFDDFKLFTLENLDASLEMVYLPDAMTAGVIPISFKVTNYGATTINTILAEYQVDNEEAVQESFDLQLASLSSEDLSFTVNPVLIPGTYNIRVSLLFVNGEEDDVLDNNTLSITLSCAYGEVAKVPMIEHFSSSTCGPCVSVNTTMLNFCNNNAGKFTYTKYQMNWPGNGDPYYTEEGGVRRTYYGCNAVPQVFLDGEDQGYAAVTQATFDEHCTRPSFVDIRGAFTTEGTVINVGLDVLSYVDVPDAYLFVSVNEKETHGNVGTNGETSFHHVFMKMLTSASGNPVTLEATRFNHYDFSFDMVSTHVEEMDDLEVSAWVQNMNSGEIFNSRFLYNDIYPYPVENLQLVDDDETKDGEMLITWDAPANGNPTGYNVMVNGVLVAENLNALSYGFDGQVGQLYIVQVQAVYTEEIVSVNSVAYKVSTWNTSEVNESRCDVFPNPANESVRIQSNGTIQTVNVYNALGMLVSKINVNGTYTEMNVSKLSAGVYFIGMEMTDGQTVTRRLVVTH